MPDLAVADVVRLKSGGHDMTVQEIKEDGVTCIWSDGKQVRSKTFNPALLLKSGARAITQIERRIVYPHEAIDKIVSEMRDAGSSADDGSFRIAVEQARLILNRWLGPEAN